jgi:hypothetical protein
VVRLCGCVEQVMERGGEKQTTFICQLDFVLPVGNLMLPIENTMVDDGCIATTSGRPLFCL